MIRNSIKKTINPYLLKINTGFFLQQELNGYNSLP